MIPEAIFPTADRLHEIVALSVALEFHAQMPDQAGYLSSNATSEIKALMINNCKAAVSPPFQMGV